MSRIVVCAATGQQGREVVRQLLAAGSWDVVALSRTPEGDAALALRRDGARVVRADLLDAASLAAAFAGAHGVFGVTQPWSPDYRHCDVQSELRQGRNVVDACVEAGVRHVVLSTVLSAGGGRTGVPHVDSKLEVEAYARERRLPVTIVRPASFMDNIGSRFFPVKNGKVRGFVAADAKVPYVACADIGGVVSVAFDRGPTGIATEIPAIGDFVSGDELALLLSRLHGGRRFRYSAPPALLMRLFAREFYAMRRAFETHGRPPYPPQIGRSIAELRQLWPQATTMEAFLRRRGYGTALRAA